MANSDKLLPTSIRKEMVPNNSDVNKVEEDSVTRDTLQCFVCDARVQGRHYALATCRTQSTRTRVIEKLGELVGERYMVVISEDDVICRSCANLINTLDRLESEMDNVRDNVLKFLEQKYSLEEGELRGTTDKRRRCQPPQITKCNKSNISSITKKKDAIHPFHTSDRSKSKRSNVWMQCDKCRYTTNHNSFMLHHVRDRVKQRVSCDKCGMQFHGKLREATHECTANQQKSETSEAFKETIKNVSVKCTDEDAMCASIVGKSIEHNVSMTSIQPYLQSEVSNQDENIPLIPLSNPENIHIRNILTPDGIPLLCQPMYVRVLQQDHRNETQTSMIATDAEGGMEVKVTDGPSKQMLTLTEDGNLEMIDVSWNDVPSTDPDPGIPFP